jgi:predicted dehydrogenase
MARTRIAIIGLGMAVAPHAKSLLDLANKVEVVAAYSPTEVRRQTFADTYGFPVGNDLEAIFDDRSIDALLILTPPNTHLDLVSRAAKAGKHILLEKPLEISTDRSEALVAAADAAGVTLGVVLQNRFRPANLALRDLIAEGRLGTIVGTSARLRNWRPQSYYDEPGRGTLAHDGGGVLLTQAIHTIDLLISLVGLPVEVTAYAATSAIHRMETEDIVAAAMRYENGALGTLSATTTAFPGFPEEIEIIGTRGTASLSGGKMRANFHDGGIAETGDETTGGTGAQPMAFQHDNHRALIADFIAAIEAGRPPMVSGAEALKSHDLIDALLQSSASGLSRQVRHRK